MLINKDDIRLSKEILSQDPPPTDIKQSSDTSPISAGQNAVPHTHHQIS